MQPLRLLLPFFLLFGAAVGSTAATEQQKQTNCSHSLRCWLSELQVDVPEQSFNVGAGIKVTVTNTTCCDIALERINSYRRKQGVAFNVSGVGVHCTGAVGALGIKALMKFDLAPTSTFDGALDMVPGQDGLASACNASACTASLKVGRLAFTGDNWLTRILNAAIDLFRDRITSTLDTLVCDQYRTFVDDDLTKLLRTVNARLRPYVVENIFRRNENVDADSDADSDHLDSTKIFSKRSDDYVTWLHNPFVGLIEYALNDIVGTDGPLGINTAANYITNGTGVASWDDTAISITANVLDAANVTLTLERVDVSGLNTWTQFDLLVPVGNRTLATHTATSIVAFDALIGVRVENVRGTSIPLVERALLSTNMTDDRLSSLLTVLVSKEQFGALHDDQLVNPACLLHTVHQATMTQLLFNMTAQCLSLKALDHGVEQDVDDALNNVFALFVGSYRSAIPAFFNTFVAQPLLNYTNEKAAALLSRNNNGTATCSELSAPASTLNIPMTIGALLTASAIAIAIVTYITCMERKRLLNDYMLILEASAPPDDDLVALQPSSGATRYSPFASTPPPVPANDPALHIIWRAAVPVVTVFTLAAFAISNASLGTSVYVHLSNLDLGEASGAARRLPSLGNFSMVYSVRKMWDAGLYALAILVALLSGTWPYVKLVAMLTCWFLPMRGRETMLIILDALGKWSLIDAYVLIMMMASFRLHVEVPTSPAAVDITVEPQIGFHLFIGATVVSLALSHIMVALDRYRRKQALVTNKHFRIPLLFFAVLLVPTATFVVGMVLPSVRFEFKGAVALVLGYLDQSVVRTYNVVQLGVATASASFTPGALGVRFLQLMFFMMTVLLPATQLIILWFVSVVSYLKQFVVPYWLLFATEIVCAWAAVDVFVVASIAALFQLEQFAQYILDHRCDLINGILRQYYNGALHQDALCFDVVASLQTGCWLLLVSCVFSTACSLYLLHNYRKDPPSELNDDEGRLYIQAPGHSSDDESCEV